VGFFSGHISLWYWNGGAGYGDTGGRGDDLYDIYDTEYIFEEYLSYMKSLCKINVAIGFRMSSVHF
jgi:hypothetical protein